MYCSAYTTAVGFIVISSANITVKLTSPSSQRTFFKKIFRKASFLKKVVLKKEAFSKGAYLHHVIAVFSIGKHR
ncbi:MAG: hypothetical protein CL599_15910 [Alteromonas sp.]|nr:hypothetical protein [Alteromonas sp.]OUX84602.1 MAG: hypothetical protein CBB95_15550 [Alteromonas sp. TMED35]